MTEGSVVADPLPPGGTAELSRWSGERLGEGLEDRGETRIENRVVEKIAAQAVREIDNATGSVRRVLGLSLGAAKADTGARVSARVDGPVAMIELNMTVIYPAPVREVTRRTRQHIINRVLELTGVTVREVDITVDGMSVQRSETSRVR